MIGDPFQKKTSGSFQAVNILNDENGRHYNPPHCLKIMDPEMHVYDQMNEFIRMLVLVLEFRGIRSNIY